MAQVSSQQCSLCDENNGAYYCYECQHALCTLCRKRHGKIPALSEHTVADINTINLSIVNRKSQCETHDKEILFYCTECSNLICSKCVTSTHRSHAISDICDVVEEEREKASENLQQMKLKTEAISSLQEKIRLEHIENLHLESEKLKGKIESVCKDLQSFIEAMRNIKITEVEDIEKIENQNFEAFLKNSDTIYKRYIKTLSELENLLLQKHDVTFYLGYRQIQNDMQTLVSIPDVPPFARVPRFEDETLYMEVLEHMDSKRGKSLCQNCSAQKKQIEDLQSEYNMYKETFHRDLKSKDDELKTLSEDIKALKEEKNTMQLSTGSMPLLVDVSFPKVRSPPAQPPPMTNTLPTVPYPLPQRPKTMLGFPSEEKPPTPRFSFGFPLAKTPTPRFETFTPNHCRRCGQNVLSDPFHELSCKGKNT